MRSAVCRKAHCLDRDESSGEMRIGGRSGVDVRTNGAFASLACRQPRYLMSLSDLETGGFASPPYDGFALTVRGQSTAPSIVHRCGASHPTESPRR